MAQKVFVFDPTASDQLSQVRGVGRYLQILKENCSDWIFTDDLKQISSESIFINPFFNFGNTPLLTTKIAHQQIAIIHDLIPLKYPGHFPLGLKGKLNVYLNKLALKNYDLVITDSQTSKTDIVKMLKIDTNKVKVIYPCLPGAFTGNKKLETRNKQAPNNKDSMLNTKYCIYVGDATWNKNLVNIAIAVKSANVNCVFVGRVFLGQYDRTRTNPWLNELNQLLDLAKGDPRFVFPGFVSDQELVQLYKNARCNVLVSRDEGFGFSYLEASNYSIPSVLADVSILRETAQDTALFANPNDSQDIANKITQLFTNEELNKTLGQEAKERTRFFSAINFRQQFDDALNL